MIDFVLCGSGWRVMFYVRLARLCPRQFKLVSLYTRNRFRAKNLLSEGIKTTDDLDIALSEKHSCVIVASGKEHFLPLLKKLWKNGEKIITETSFLTLGDEELEQAEEINGCCMEQYWYTPLYSSIWSSLGYIGKVDQVYLSALHNHHAASICRRLFPDAVLLNHSLTEYESQCVNTGSRMGREEGGELRAIHANLGF